jgi:hypothetical protein
MPYSVGAQGSYGCSGYPVVEEGGKVVGCHATEAEATNHLQALYANVKDAQKDAVASVMTSDVPENPSANINPAAGMKHPELHNPEDPECKCMKCMMNKGCTDMSKDCGDPMCKVCMHKIWAGSAFERKKSFGHPSANNPLPAKHSGPNTAPAGVVNHPKSTQNTI